MVKLHYNGNIDEIMVEHKQYIKPITKFALLHKIINLKWFPDFLHIRVYGDNISSDNSLDISNLSSGMYIIKFEDETGKTVTKKLSIFK
jgi:hypothetical protein